MTAAGARVEDGFPHHSRRSTLWCVTRGCVTAWSHLIPDDPCIHVLKASPWFSVIHQLQPLWANCAPAIPSDPIRSAWGGKIHIHPMKSRDHSEYLQKMDKLETSRALTPHFRNDLSTHLWTSALDVRMTNSTLCHWPSNFWCSHLFSAGLPLQSVSWNLEWFKIVELTKLDDLSKAERECHPSHTS